MVDIIKTGKRKGARARVCTARGWSFWEKYRDVACANERRSDWPLDKECGPGVMWRAGSAVRHGGFTECRRPLFPPKVMRLGRLFWGRRDGRRSQHGDDCRVVLRTLVLYLEVLVRYVLRGLLTKKPADRGVGRRGVLVFCYFCAFFRWKRCR